LLSGLYRLAVNGVQRNPQTGSKFDMPSPKHCWSSYAIALPDLLRIWRSEVADWPHPKLEAAIRGGVQIAYLGNGIAFARILGRHNILLRSSDRGFVCHLMLDVKRGMTLTLDEVTRQDPKVDLVTIDAEGGEPGIVAGMRKLVARDHSLIVLEYNAARYPEPGRFLDELPVSSGAAHELATDGTIIPLDSKSVLDQTSLEDRISLFGWAA
jgi:hypothetical protein